MPLMNCWLEDTHSMIAYISSGHDQFVVVFTRELMVNCYPHDCLTCVFCAQTRTIIVTHVIVIALIYQECLWALCGFPVNVV